MPRLLPASGTLPHLRESSLQMTREPDGVEKRISLPVSCQFRFDCAQRRWVARQIERDGFIFVERFCNHLGQTGRVQQARCDSSGKRFPSDVKTGTPAHNASLAVVWAL